MTGTDMVIAQKLHDLTNTASRIVGAITTLEFEADKAEETLDRVSVVDDDSLGRAMELVRSITSVTRTGNETRLAFTNPIKAVADEIKTMFDKPIERLSDVSKAVKKQADSYIVAENKRKREIAAQEAAEAEERALAAAQEAEARGDTGGAEQILSQAAAVISAPSTAAVKSTTVFGSTVYTKVTTNVVLQDKLAFLKWAVGALTQLEIDKIDVPKSLLNSLVATRVDKDEKKVIRAIPGVSVTFTEGGAIA